MPTSSPDSTTVLHFTHIDNLKSVIHQGLLADNRGANNRLVNDVGHPDVKRRRRVRIVPVEPGGSVSDYVPFYFAERSPMMYMIRQGGVPTYAGSCDDLVYLRSTVGTLMLLGLDVVFTDRNAATDRATFTTDSGQLNSLIDWSVMSAKMWSDTDGDPDRMERRMAECLVHKHVPWSGFHEIIVRRSSHARQA